MHVLAASLSLFGFCSPVLLFTLYCTPVHTVLQVLLVLQYSYLTAARCLCIPGDGGPGSSSGSGTDSSSSSGCVWALDTDPLATRRVFDVLGLHRTSAGVLPLFLIYLSVLMYNYLLDPYQPGMAGLSLVESGAAAVQAAGPSALGSGSSDANGNTVSAQQQQQTGSASGSRAAGAGAAAVLLVAALQGWASKLWTLQRLVAHKLWYHIRCIVCRQHRDRARFRGYNMPPMLRTCGVPVPPCSCCRPVLDLHASHLHLSPCTSHLTSPPVTTLCCGSRTSHLHCPSCLRPVLWVAQVCCPATRVGSLLGQGGCGPSL